MSVLLGILVLFGVMSALYMKVSYLENRQKAFASLPANVIKIVHGNLVSVTNFDYIQGNRQAPVTLIEYSDFECPSCQRMHPKFGKIITQYGNNIRFVQRMFPLPQNNNAEKEAEAALCAGKIGGEKKYWQYSSEIYKKTKGIEGGEGFALVNLVPLAKELGITQEAFEKCLTTGEMTQEVHNQKTSGENAGVNQLPSLFIIDKKQHVTVLTGEQALSTLQVILTYALE